MFWDSQLLDRNIEVFHKVLKGPEPRSAQAIDVGKPSEVLIEALKRPVEEEGYGSLTLQRGTVVSNEWCSRDNVTENTAVVATTTTTTTAATYGTI